MDERLLMGPVTGIVLLVTLGAVCYGIAARSSRGRDSDRISEYLLAERSIPFGLIASSVLVAWTWTTTIMGAAEAGMWYGVSGGISYSLGAGIPFLIFIPLVGRLRRLMPGGIAYTEFIGIRFGRGARDIYYIFAVLVVLYVFIAQLIGIGLVFASVFGLPFKLTVVLSAILVISYVLRGGIRGALYGNVLHFAIIFIGLGVIVLFLSRSLNAGFLFDGLRRAATDPSDPNHNPSLLLMNSMAGLRYGIIALVVALGQVLLDQGYYSVAMASRSKRDMAFGFAIGIIVAWMPIPILCANFFGHAAIALRLGPGLGIENSTDIAATILSSYGEPLLSLMFALLILSVGITTGGHSLIGIMTIFTVDFYADKLRPTANDAEKIRFGRIFTFCIAALCAFVAIALDGISLLKIDMFSGIFFAAPCGVLIVGVYSRFHNEKVTITAIFLGLVSGISIWIHFDLSAESWFYGCLMSFTVPVLIIFIAYPFTRQRFNFARLRFHKSDGA